MDERRRAEAAAARAAALRDAGAEAGSDAGANAPPRMLRGDLRPKRNVLNKVAIGVVAFLLLGVAALARRPRPPEIETSCERPSFALSSPVKQSRPVAFTIVGPPDRRYGLGVNTATFVRQGDTWQPVPLTGVPRENVVFARDEAMPRCRRIGNLSLPLPLGRHVVTLYEFTPSGSVVEVQNHTFELVLPDDGELQPIE